jgi:hypothetical protein
LSVEDGTGFRQNIFRKESKQIMSEETPETPEAPIARLEIRPIPQETIYVPIIGTSPLIVSRFSEKAKQQMLDTQQGRRRPRTARDPDEEYRASLYKGTNARRNTLYGFPASGFKQATVGAARFYGKDVKMTELRQFMFFKGRYFPEEGQQLTVINGTPVMRQDYVRLAGAGRPADLRFRGMFEQWTAVLVVSYTSSALTRDSALSLIDAGGTGVGVGEWRPEHKGEFGTYAIDDSRTSEDARREIESLRAADREEGAS